MSTADRLWGVVPAAGVGARVGAAVPKQYLPLLGRAVIEHALNVLLRVEAIESVMVALNPQDDIARTLECFESDRVLHTPGGDLRADSVLAGLTALSAHAAQDDWVLVHDAARPCTDSADVSNLIERVIATQCGGILAQPVVDTVKRASADGQVLETLDRSELWRAQTPQMFRYGELKDALQRAQVECWNVTDEASAMEMAGHPVQLVAGSAQNLKITQADDLALAAFFLGKRDPEQ